MKHGSLFSGIGGFDLAAEWMGWENIFHCEWNPFGQKVLSHYWPNAISYHDITKTDFTIHRGQIDILTGGFPCQPYSLAGKRKGKEDERHLWPEMLRAIREIQPCWIVGENVFGLINWNGGLVFNEVQTDLEAEGYEVFPYVLPAASVNAPHRRDRIWFVAYAIGNRYNRNSNSARGYMDRQKSKNKEQTRDGWSGEIVRLSTKQIITNPNSNGQQRINSKYEKQPSEGWEYAQRNIKQMGKSNWSWSNFPTISPICDGNDGISDRLDSITFSKWRQESIKAGGNAVVPQVVYQIFKAIELYES